MQDDPSSLPPEADWSIVDLFAPDENHDGFLEIQRPESAVESLAVAVVQEVEHNDLARAAFLVPPSASASASFATPGKEVTVDQLKYYYKADGFGDNDTSATSHHPAQNAARQTPLSKLTLRRELAERNRHSYFSLNLDHGGMPVTNQKDSGRCWLFGTLNLFRFEARRLLNLQGFEFSEAYPYFFHLFEQCNAFMEFTIETSARPTDDRLVALKLDEPIADAGDWGIAVNLIRKYGLLPKSVYPESYSSSNTGELIDVLTDILRVAAYRLRAICNNGGEDAVDQARQHKAVVLCRAFQILCIHLGSPPTIFTWKWRDDDGTFHDMQQMTPQQFADTFVNPCYNSYVALLQDPRHTYDRLYCVEYVNTVIGECDLQFLNVTADEMKRISLAMLQDGRPVWFACNVDTQCDHDLGLWDANLYDREGFYGVDDQDEEWSSSIFGPMSKKDWILFGAPMGTHVMLITGVDVENGVPLRWRVENSWGTKIGDDGYYTMNDNWFDEYVFEIIAPPAYLSDADCDALTKDPVVLPGWDPMSTTVSRRRVRH